MKKFTMSCIAILSVMASPQAFSADAKIYPGAECERHSGSTSYDHSSGIFRNSSSTQSLTVVCPITKDIMAKSIQDGWIKVVDLSKDKDFTCSIKSKHRKKEGGWTNYWSGNKKSSGFGTHTQRLNFNGMGQVSHHSHYYLTCVIPPKDVQNGSSYILSYRVDENT